MIRLDAFARRFDPAWRDTPHLARSASRSPGPDESGRQPRPIELTPADHEEPTWEVRHPGDPRRRRLDGRTRAILAVAAAAAVVVNAGAAWMYWRITGSQTGSAGAETVVDLALRGRSDLNRPLLPGDTGNMTVTVTNDNDFPIRITAVTPAPGAVVADDDHRDAGCTDPGVTVTRERFAVSWEVPRNTIGAYTIPAALTMRHDAGPECAGAVFTVPIQATGLSRRTA